MGDGAEIVNMSDGKEKKLSEDRISDEQVERNELVGSDEAWDNEEEVFEEAIGSLEAPKTESFEAVGSHEGLPLEATPENSKDEHDEVVDVLEEERGVKGSKVNYSVVGESHGEVNVQLVTSGEAEPDLVTPKINDDKGEAGQEIPHGQIESSLDVVENSEKATSNGSNLAAEDVNMQNGNTHSFQENGMVSPENKELVAEVISISVRSEETRNDGIEDGNWEEKADVSAGMEREEEVGEGEGTNMNFSKKGFVCIDNESGAQRNGETGAGYNSVKMASGDKSLNDSVEVLNDGTSSPLEKSSPEEKGETEGHSSSSFPGVTFREHETVQNGNKRHDVQHSPQRNKELEKQQGSIVNIEELFFYRELETCSQLEFKAYAAAGTVYQNYAYIMLLRLRQACDHPHLVKKSYVNDGDKEHLLFRKSNFMSTKIKAVMETLESLAKQGSRNSLPIKTIVFSQWTGMLDLVEHCFVENGIKSRRLDGTMSLVTSNRAVQEFNNDPNVQVMLMSLKAGNLELNMVSACHVILLDLWWNPTTEDQAIDRAHRIGQTRTVTATRMTIKNTVEERILALQESKRELVASALGEDPGELSATRLTVEDLQYLFYGV